MYTTMIVFYTSARIYGMTTRKGLQAVISKFSAPNGGFFVLLLHVFILPLHPPTDMHGLAAELLCRVVSFTGISNSAGPSSKTATSKPHQSSEALSSQRCSLETFLESGV